VDVQLVVFSLAAEAYALPVGAVREVVPYAAPRSLGRPEPWQLGVVALRGEVLPVWDLAARLGLATAAEPGAFLVALGADGPVGLVVDGVSGVVTVAADAIETLPLAAGAAVTGMATIGDRLVVALDPRRLLGGPADELDGLSKRELQRLAREAQIPGRSRLDRDALLAALRARRA
jgi:purine-binding chemotaxis protein CheW